MAAGARQANLIADGVYRCGTELVSWYLVEDGGRLTIVDAGAPGYWPQLDEALGELVSELAVAQTPLRALDDWLEPYRRQWAESLDALERRLDKG